MAPNTMGNHHHYHQQPPPASTTPVKQSLHVSFMRQRCNRLRKRKVGWKHSSGFVDPRTGKQGVVASRSVEVVSSSSSNGSSSSSNSSSNSSSSSSSFY
ncbi:hypothetical protein M0802_006569 [Mischocyttarus mexicanus]|nr:hypothetical protein M0802_006569 [Mischocyttarus mexicanus]